MIQFKEGMTLIPYGTGVKCTLVEMDPDFSPPRWVKLQDPETSEVHLVTENEYGFKE